MPTMREPSGWPRQAKAPALRCLGAAVLTADQIDYWIRRRMVACPLGAADDVATQLRSADVQTPVLQPTYAPSSAPRPVRPSRVPVRMKPALACDRRVWLSALGRALKDEYDALAVPVPARLAALVRQLEAQN